MNFLITGERNVLKGIFSLKMKPELGWKSSSSDWKRCWERKGESGRERDGERERVGDWEWNELSHPLCLIYPSLNFELWSDLWLWNLLFLFSKQRERERNLGRKKLRERVECEKGERKKTNCQGRESVCERERVRRNGNSIKRKIAKFIAGHLQDN